MKLTLTDCHYNTLESALYTKLEDYKKDLANYPADYADQDDDDFTFYTDESKNLRELLKLIKSTNYN